ncbi:TNF receptor-associated factor 3, partial [Paramuricea clavata]
MPLQQNEASKLLYKLTITIAAKKQVQSQKHMSTAVVLMQFISLATDRQDLSIFPTQNASSLDMALSRVQGVSKSSGSSESGSAGLATRLPYINSPKRIQKSEISTLNNHIFTELGVAYERLIVEMKLNEVSSGSVTSIVNIAGTPVQQTSGSVRVKLPKLEVKKFKGSVFEWQEFWDAFESSIHTNVGLSDVDKFSYLKGLVEEPAKSAISGFSLTAANYGSAVELLKRRFGKPVTIQRAHINELLNLQGVYKERETGRLRALYDKIECHYRGLVALKVGEATYSNLLDQFRVELELREEAVVLVPNDGRQSGYGKRERNKVKDTREPLCEKKNTERDDDKEGTSCNHKSYVTAKTANLAGLKVLRKELLGLSTFGQKAKEMEVREVVRVDVNPLGSGKVLTLEAYVVPVISRALTKARMTLETELGFVLSGPLKGKCGDDNDGTLQLDA